MSSPCTGILKTSGFTGSATTIASNTTTTGDSSDTAHINNINKCATTNIGNNSGGNNNNNGSNSSSNNNTSHNTNQRSLTGSPSVQFSDQVVMSDVTNSAGGDNPTSCCVGDGWLVRVVRTVLDRTRDPLDRCRAATLKIIHCRLMLMVICALVVIECACVMSELMVDLHGIKLRFDNEAEEINKFVAHFRNKHPDAFKSVELRRMKDFMHLLKTSTTPASLDADLCHVCHPKSSELHGGPHQAGDSNDFTTMTTTKTTGSLFETTKTANGARFPGSLNQVSPTSKANIVGNYQAQTVAPNSNGDKLSLIEMKPKSNNDGMRNDINGNKSEAENTYDKNESLSTSTTTATSMLDANNQNSVLDSVTSSKSIHSNPNISNVNEVNKYIGKEIPPHILPTKRNDNNTIINDDNSTTSSSVLVTGATVNMNEVTRSSAHPNNSRSTGPLVNEQPPLNTLKPLKETTNQSEPVIIDGGENISTIDSKANNANDRGNANQMISPQQSNSKKVAKETKNHIFNFRNENDSHGKNTSIHSAAENFFILAINNVKENFFLIAEMLPNHVKQNGSLHSRYMEEYKNVYKTSKALHYTSLTILGIMVIETVVKLFCTGCRFFHKKLEVFDAVIVILSFSLDVMFLDSQWYETGKDATALLVLLLPWRVVRIVNSFVMTIKHKHHIQMMNLKRGKKKAELKTAKVQSLLKEIRKDVQLLVSLCKSAKIDENSINACLYGKGRTDGATQTLMETCASLVLISTLGKIPPQEDDIYGTIIQEALYPEVASSKSLEKQQEEEAAIDAAIALDDKIEAKRKSSRRRPSLSIRLQKAIHKRSNTMPRRCASLEIPDAENRMEMEMEAAENNVFYVHEDTGDIVPEGDYVIIDGDGRYYIRDIILSDEESQGCDGSQQPRRNTCSEL